MLSGHCGELTAKSLLPGTILIRSNLFVVAQIVRSGKSCKYKLNSLTFLRMTIRLLESGDWAYHRVLFPFLRNDDPIRAIVRW